MLRTRGRRFWLGATALAAVVALLVVVAVIRLTDEQTEPVAGGLKQPIVGLMDRHGEPAEPMRSVIKAYVVETSWASLQPTAGGPLAHPNDIDTAVQNARSRGYTLKLRVRAGLDAPQWAKQIGGAPFPVYFTDSTGPDAGEQAGTVGRYWLPEFGAAYADLQRKLAAAYDDVPEIRQTDVTRCAGIYSETYLRDARDRRNVQALLAAGFTRSADDVCHDEQLQSHTVWRRTLTDVAFNPYSAISADGKVKTDLAYTIAQMSQCRRILGERCVLQNNSISAGRANGAGYAAMYEAMRKLGGAISFQTATAAKLGDPSVVLAWAAEQGALSVELPTGYARWTQPQLAAGQAALAAAASRAAAARSTPTPAATAGGGHGQG